MISIEAYLRYIKKENLGYVELNGGFAYYSNYHWHNWWDNQTLYRPEEPKTFRVENKTEFVFEHQYNNLGFKGPDIVPKKKKEYRILALGDSFTEGVGAPDNFTWPFLLQKKLNIMNSDTTVINLGKSGNDPVYAFKALQDTFIKLAPDMILLAINRSDISDIISRGTYNERYPDNTGKIHYKRGPWWEFFYSYSFIVRHIVHSWLGYNRLLTRDSDLYPKAANALAEVILHMQQYCVTRSIDFRVLIIPGQEEMKARNLYDCLGITWQQLQKYGVPIIFLPELYEKAGMNASNTYQYYWQKDCHHNKYGYELLADCVFFQIKNK